MEEPGSGSVGTVVESGASRGIMVEFVKQVHLQKEVGARLDVSWTLGCGREAYEGLQAARATERKVRKSRR